MKPLKNFLLIIPVFFCSYNAKITSPKITKTIYERHVPQKEAETGAFLMYIGNIGNMFVDAQIEMVTTIGIQYSVSFSSGKDQKGFLSHMAIFYKFSKPDEAVYYNYLTHQSNILTSEGSTNDDGGPNVTVVGTETINKYPCTHLVHQSGNSKEEYWMSTKVPGFETLVKKLNKIDPSLVMGSINETIFNWGGLVKVKWSGKEGEVGNLDLSAASTNAPIPATDFDPPKK